MFAGKSQTPMIQPQPSEITIYMTLQEMYVLFNAGKKQHLFYNKMQTHIADCLNFIVTFFS